MSQQHEAIRAEFDAQASSWAALDHRDDPDLAWVVGRIAPLAADIVLTLAMLEAGRDAAGASICRISRSTSGRLRCCPTPTGHSRSWSLDSYCTM